MYLIQPLPENPLDIIGDVHGEYIALLALLTRLGYNDQGQHRKDRKLVFVGDLCDRGPDSYAVIKLVQHLVQQGNAQVILGNHEINLLINDAKDGSGWFFDERYEHDQKNYAPFHRTPIGERQAIREFLENLPIALQRNDIRIVHAAWTPAAIAAISTVPLGQITTQFLAWDDIARSVANESGLYDRYLHEKQKWAKELEDEQDPPPFLHAIAEYEAMQQMVNPLKVLTSGVEQQATTPFFAGNRWRFSDRISWWNGYSDDIPVVIGHYWRLFQAQNGKTSPRYSQLFKNIAPTGWHGKNNKVFCIDYSVGARWRDRKTSRTVEKSRFKLAALQWPENQVVFDTGEVFPTY
ncbi:metallophosphoesterase [Alcaligenaceae bacterium]|nr:metallophosphoesterase [Alcaligenaceae bacterium]